MGPKWRCFLLIPTGLPPCCFRHSRAVARIVLENVSRTHLGPRRQRVQAVRSLNLDVADGEFIAVLGRSGFGKTRILRLMAGFDKPDGGTLTIVGCAVNDIEPQAADPAVV